MSKQSREDQPRAPLEKNRLDGTKPAKFVGQTNEGPGKHHRGKQGK